METQLWPSDYPVHPDHCRDVLMGSYNVAYDPIHPPIILDLGANIGAFTRWAVKRWPGCTVHAYEPHPDNFKLLQRTVAELEKGEAKVHCHEVAVFDQHHTAMLFENGFNCGEYTLLDQKNGRGGVPVTVIPATDLPKADVLKMDVEGSELFILRSLQDRLHEFSAVMLEAHASHIATEAGEILTMAGFREVGRHEHAPHRVELRFLKATVPAAAVSLP